MHNIIWRMSAVALAVIATTAIVAGVSYARDNEMFGEKFNNLGNKEAAQTALNNNDYDAWLEAVGPDSSIAGKITAENFSKLVEINQLRQQINVLEEDLGVKGLGMEGGRGFHGKMEGGGMMENMESAREALENNDYNA